MFAMGILGLGVLLMMAVVAAIAVLVAGLFLLLPAILLGIAFIRHRMVPIRSAPDAQTRG